MSRRHCGSFLWDTVRGLGFTWSDMGSLWRILSRWVTSCDLAVEYPKTQREALFSTLFLSKKESRLMEVDEWCAPGHLIRSETMIQSGLSRSVYKIKQSNRLLLLKSKLGLGRCYLCWGMAQLPSLRASEDLFCILLCLATNAKMLSIKAKFIINLAFFSLRLLMFPKHDISKIAEGTNLRP